MKKTGECEEMINILELKDKYAGRAGIVLGGGPSLERDVVLVRARHVSPLQRPVWIAVNYHAVNRLAELQADYMVFIDEPNEFPKLRAAAEAFRGIKVTWRPGWSDVELTPSPSPEGGGEMPWIGVMASHLATWFACYLGCEPVILAGMDCYQGQRSADADPRDLAYQIPLSEHLAGWRQAFERCPHPERIRAVSGPLVEVFGGR
jgi:hypothetical protein